MVAQNCGVVLQFGNGVRRQGGARPADAVVDVLGGSLPKVLHGLPIGAGAV